MTASDGFMLGAVGLLIVTASFMAGLGVCAWSIRWKPPFGQVDFPGGPLRHRVAVPMNGGPAIYLAIVVILALGVAVCTLGRPFLPEGIARYIDGVWYRSGEFAVVFGLATLTMVVGYLSDLFQLGWKPRLVAQILFATLLATYGTRVTLFWPFSYPLVGGFVTVLWVVGLTNAFTFLDNMDGLAGGVGLIAALVFAATQAQVGSLFAPAVLLVVAGVVAGFLVFNRYPARLLLGNSGSDFLGFLLGALTVAGTYYRYGQHESPNSVLSPLLVMAVPLYESIAVFLIWLTERDQPFLWNHRHFSYRLIQSGFSPRQAVALLLLVSLGAGLGSLLLRQLDVFGTCVLMGQLVCLIAVVAVIELSAIRREKHATSLGTPVESTSEL